MTTSLVASLVSIKPQPTTGLPPGVNDGKRYPSTYVSYNAIYNRQGTTLYKSASSALTSWSSLQHVIVSSKVP